MKVHFPAMQGQMGTRIYYACLMKLSVIPKMFTFTDWAEFTPDDREQRILNKKRIPDIARYVVDNEESYLFSSIVASYKSEARFRAVVVGTENGTGAKLGELEMSFEDAAFIINDGQHRCAAIAQAIKANPALGEQTISVLLFPYESRERTQQMFSDLNRFVVKTSKTLNILFDKRDPLADITREMIDLVPVFKGLVEKDAVSLPVRSPKLFSLSALYDANKELLEGSHDGSYADLPGLTALAVDFWTAVSRAIPEWLKVKAGDLKPLELRQESISAHATVLRAIGGVGAQLLTEQPKTWHKKIADLASVDWHKANREWEGLNIIGNTVISNRQARTATRAFLKKHLSLALTETEHKALADAPNVHPPTLEGEGKKKRSRKVSEAQAH